MLFLLLDMDILLEVVSLDSAVGEVEFCDHCYMYSKIALCMRSLIGLAGIV